MNAMDPISIGKRKLRNRIIRSATYEGSSGTEGIPANGFFAMYEQLAANHVGAIITGFAFTAKNGRAMQNAQSGMDNDDKIPYFSELTRIVHYYDCPIYMQISHCGRQTTKARAGGNPRGVSSKASLYFRSRPETMPATEVKERVKEYVDAADRARKAGFDGVQVHAAHGYLIHQFLMNGINKRKDEYGIDKKSGLGTLFLQEIIEGIREKCGDDFAILIKISGGVDIRTSFTEDHFRSLVAFLDKMKVDAIEVSYGTMDHALNIFRGDIPLEVIQKVNPFFKTDSKFRMWINKTVFQTYFKRYNIPFTPMYNLPYAGIAKEETSIPIISVGGFRNLDQINDAIGSGQTDMVGLSRPFICEPELIYQIENKKDWKSRCVNCNYCAIMCDSGKPTRCYN